MAKFCGIIVYEIKENGNLLIGNYSNSGLRHPSSGQYDIDSEIVRKRPNDNLGLAGRYECRYICTGETEVTVCDLKITKVEEVYEFEWMGKGGLIWVGLGMMAGNNHIAVAYRKP